MPATIALAIFLSGLFVMGWAIVGICVMWLLAGFPDSAPSAVWIPVVVLGVLLNAAIVYGIVRHADWGRWLVVLQALVLTVVLGVIGSFAVWGILAVAIQSVLVVVSPSTRWFRNLPAARTRPNTRATTGEAPGRRDGAF